MRWRRLKNVLFQFNFIWNLWNNFLATLAKIWRFIKRVDIIVIEDNIFKPNFGLLKRITTAYVLNFHTLLHLRLFTAIWFKWKVYGRALWKIQMKIEILQKIKWMEHYVWSFIKRFLWKCDRKRAESCPMIKTNQKRRNKNKME